MQTVEQELYRNLVCPICKKELVFEPRAATCQGCHCVYLVDKNGSVNFIPRKLPHLLESRFTMWDALQANGSVSYSLAPQLNLFSEEQGTTIAFKQFAALSGSILDIGCGPQRGVPAYAKSEQISSYIGVDPLRGGGERDFVFFQALGELLPFKAETFDSVILSSCLDHMLDYQSTLNESFRVLHENGKVYIMADDVTSSELPNNTLRRLIHLFFRGSRQAVTAFGSMGLIRSIKYLTKMSFLPIPKEAADPFHYRFPTRNEILDALKFAGFRAIRYELFSPMRMIFFEAKKT